MGWGPLQDLECTRARDLVIISMTGYGRITKGYRSGIMTFWLLNSDESSDSCIKIVFNISELARLQCKLVFSAKCRYIHYLIQSLQKPYFLAKKTH